MRPLSLRARALLAAAALASLLAGFHELVFVRMPGVFRDPVEDMSFGWFIPLFSLYVLWTERARVRASLGEPGWGGIALSLPFIAAGFLGARGMQVRLEIVAFAGLLVSVAWAFFGRRAAKAVLFPACFLLFCIPLATFLDVVTIHLRLLASSVAYWTLETFGADVVRAGTMICAADGSFSIDVAEPCSGLRSIFALMALTAGYAYFSQPTWPRRAALFAVSVPLAILGNVMRILTICLVAQFASPEFASGFYHDYSGYVVFIVAILLMLACGEALTRWCDARDARRTGGAAVAADGAASPEAPVPAAVPLAAFAVLVTAMAFQTVSPEVTLAEAPDVRFREIPGLEMREILDREAEETVLPADTKVEKCVYIAPDGRAVLATAVVGGRSRSSIHRPEMCMPAQGFQMVSPRTVDVDGREWRFITLRRGGGESGIAYTFFNQDGCRTASHTRRILRDVLDRSVLNRIDRWVMVQAVAPRGDDEALADAARTAGRGLGW